MRKLATTISAALIAAAMATTASAQTAKVFSLWNSSEGQITFAHPGGSSISGSYTKDDGRITGRVANHHLEGFWIQRQSARRCTTSLDGSYYWGRVALDFTSGRSFTGHWSYCERPVSPGYGEWTGSLIRVDIPALGKYGPGSFDAASLFGGAPMPAPLPAPAPVAGPMAKPCYSNSGAIANVGPCSSGIGSTLTIRQLRTTSGPLGSLVFKAVLANGVPAQVVVPLTSGGSPYSATVPPQLCAAGGPRWEVWLRTAGGANQGSIGSFQPDCR
jgi:hypothetical protein